MQSATRNAAPAHAATRHASCAADGMTAEHWIGLGVAAAVCVYLVHALVRAERY